MTHPTLDKLVEFVNAKIAEHQAGEGGLQESLDARAILGELRLLVDSLEPDTPDTKLPLDDSTTYTFTVTGSESDVRAALDGPALRSAAEEFRNWLRNEIKYQDQPYEPVREMFHEFFGGLLE